LISPVAKPSGACRVAHEGDCKAWPPFVARRPSFNESTGDAIASLGDIADDIRLLHPERT
jgi:hypothetical protein